MATRYLPSPLTDAFFSDFNREKIHSAIIKAVRDKTGYTIDRQNDGDLQALMRSVFVDMATDVTTNVRQQVDAMNKQVVVQALQPIQSGILQQLVYLKDISSNPVPLDTPVSTSTYGNKIPSNFKIGF
jgi:hypothetical protein